MALLSEFDRKQNIKNDVWKYIEQLLDHRKDEASIRLKRALNQGLDDWGSRGTFYPQKPNWEYFVHWCAWVNTLHCELYLAISRKNNAQSIRDAGTWSDGPRAMLLLECLDRDSVIDVVIQRAMWLYPMVDPP